MAGEISEILGNFRSSDWVRANCIRNTYQSTNEASRYSKHWLRIHLGKVLNLQHQGAGLQMEVVEREATVGHPRIAGTLLSTTPLPDSSGEDTHATLRTLRQIDTDDFHNPIDLAMFDPASGDTSNPVPLVNLRPDGYFMCAEPGWQISQTGFNQLLLVVNHTLKASGLVTYNPANPIGVDLNTLTGVRV